MSELDLYLAYEYSGILEQRADLAEDKLEKLESILKMSNGLLNRSIPFLITAGYANLADEINTFLIENINE